MNSRSDSNSPSGAAAWALPALLLLFVGSGCSALVYEIVWFQLLQLVIGSSAISIGVLLGTFMGGMCLGSLGLARVVSTRWHPLRVYGLLELGIGVIGVVLLFAMPLIGRQYTALAGLPIPAVLVRGVICSLCLLPPTILMGATLPAIARWMETTPQGVSRLGFFYGANIAGAVFGCLLAGFYLLRVYDIATATYTAVAINVVVALAALGLAMLAAYRPPTVAKDVGPEDAATEERGRVAWSAYVAIGLSGMAALGAEVVWTRQLSLMLGATVYTFSIILAVFLVGLGIGSTVGAYMSRGRISPRAALGVCQLLLTLAILWTAVMLSKSLPYWPIDPSLSRSPWFAFQLDLLRSAWVVLPAACLWGASFPLALAAAASGGQDPGKLVGGVYAANTLGAIFGAVGFAMLAIGWLGTQTAQQVLVALSAAAALLMFAPLLWQAFTARGGQGDDRFWTGRPATLTLTTAAVAAVAVVALVPPAPPGLIAYGRFLPTYWQEPEYLYVGEGTNASIAVSENLDGVRNFHVSGKVVASSEFADMRLQFMLGHIPALLHEKPKSVLVVGCGAGVTAGTFVLHPGLERIVICEIEPLIPPAAREYFAYENYGVLDDPRVEVVFDDARHFIVTTDEKFDIITSDPIHPWVKGAAALYSKEYFELCKTRLNPGGVVTQWVPLYESNEAAVKSEVATFLEAFPDGTIWSNDQQGEGYDIVLLGQVGRARIDADALQQRLEREDHTAVLESLAEIDLGSAVRLLRTYAGQADDVRQWLADAEINHDRNLRLQYLAGMGVNSYQADAIFNAMTRHCKYPDNLFVSTGTHGQVLKKLFEFSEPQGE
ncbi:MAG: fused MFS/spermidine synthase [Pirellulaceae bacterium]